MIDWNKLKMEQYIEHLEEQYAFSSSGTAKCIFELIEAYKAEKERRIELEEAILSFAVKTKDESFKKHFKIKTATDGRITKK